VSFGWMRHLIFSMQCIRGFLLPVREISFSLVLGSFTPHSRRSHREPDKDRHHNISVWAGRKIRWLKWRKILRTSIYRSYHAKDPTAYGWITVVVPDSTMWKNMVGSDIQQPQSEPQHYDFISHKAMQSGVMSLRYHRLLRARALP
jgi:hypothetical protein